MNLKYWIFLFFTIFLNACTHTVSFRDSHFATPIVSSKQWSGNFTADFYGKTNVTLISNTSTNPPTRGTIGVNKDITFTDLLFLSNIGYSFYISPYEGLDFFSESPLWGFQWQFLNHKASEHQWIGSLRGAYGTWTSSSSSSDSTNGTIKSESNVISAYAGISLGYKVNSKFIPYYSFVHEVHDTTSKITNQYGVFPNYLDHGVHGIQSIGITSEGPGLIYTLEYSMIQIQWTQTVDSGSTTDSYQNTYGMKIGYGW